MYYKLRRTRLYYKPYSILAYTIKKSKLRSLKGLTSQIQVVDTVPSNLSTPPPPQFGSPGGVVLLFPHNMGPIFAPVCPGYSSLIELCQGILLIGEVRKSADSAGIGSFVPRSRL